MRTNHCSTTRLRCDCWANDSGDKGFTLVELLIVIAVIGIIAALAVAGLLRARIAANETSAIGSLRAINSAQQAYASSCANGFYASGLPILHSAPPGSAPFISSDLGATATVRKSGYAIVVGRGTDGVSATRDACNPLGLSANLSNAYYATAVRETPLTGSRYFWTSTQGTIYFDRDNPIAHTEGLTSPPAPAQPLEAAP